MRPGEASPRRCYDAAMVGVEFDENENMTCEGCGAELPAFLDGCPYCDEELAEETMPCPHCGGQIHEDSQQCPICGDYVSMKLVGKQRDRRLVYILLAIVLFIAVIILYPLLTLRGGPE